MRALGHPRLTIPYAGTGLITVDLADLVARSILTTGAYEPEVWQAIEPHIHADAVVWDVGGHIGSFAIRGLLHPQVHSVHVFEPDPRLANIIRHHFALNRGRGRVHQYALLEQDGRVRFEPAPEANRGIGRVTSSGGLEVEGRSVDSLVFRADVRAPTVMKIDVEDSEAAVLRGARRTLEERPPRAIAVELGWNLARDAMEEGEAAAILASHGYRLHHIARPGGYRESRENFIALPG